MKIDETKIFEFTFDFYGGHFSIPVRAQAREEAAQQLKKILDGFMVELATEFPIVSGSTRAHVESPPGTHDATPKSDQGEVSGGGAQGVPSYALELDIENLIKEIMPIKKPKGAQSVSRLVKEWTGFEYEPQNYLAIIDELKKLKA